MAQPQERTQNRQPRLTGVYVDGKLRFQTRDRAAADEAAAKWMNERHEVWVAPVGSFVAP